MRPSNGGSRIGIVFNGSPLFSGGAGSGESEIRRWIIDNDMLEAIIALPDQLFYNTGISTYIWIVTNRKPKERKGKIQMVNAIDYFEKMPRSLGNKRNEISDKQIEEITSIYGKFKETKNSKLFDNEYFGYTRVTVERPLRLNFQASKERLENLEEETSFINLAKTKKKGAKGLKEIEEGERLQEAIRKSILSIDSEKVYKNREEFIEVLKKKTEKQDIKLKAPILKAILKALSAQDETADICLDKDGNPEPDTDLRDCENIPLTEDIDEYFKREVLPHVPDAWMDRSKDKVGYEINFTKEFYEYKPLRNLEDIKKDILKLEKETEGILGTILDV